MFNCLKPVAKIVAQNVKSGAKFAANVAKSCAPYVGEAVVGVGLTAIGACACDKLGEKLYHAASGKDDAEATTATAETTTETQV